MTLPGIITTVAKMRPSHAADGLVIETQFADVTFLGYPISAKARFNYDPYDRILALTYLRQPHAGRGRHTAEGGLRNSLFLEIRDQGAQPGIRGIEGGQLPGVPQCRGKIPRVARDRDKRHQHVPVRRMLPMRLVQDRHCVVKPKSEREKK